MKPYKHYTKSELISLVKKLKSKINHYKTQKEFLQRNMEKKIDILIKQLKNVRDYNWSKSVSCYKRHDK